MDRGHQHWRLASLLAAACFAFSGGAFAQDGEDEEDDEVMKLPGASGASAGPDHDLFVGSFGVGFLGRRDVSIATPSQVLGGPGTSADAGRSSINTQAPVLGIRYWIDPVIGIDAGLGINLTGGSISNTDPAINEDIQGFTTFIIHGGVPIALVSEGHFSFQIVPELNVGFSTSTAEDAVPLPTGEFADLELRGLHFDVGARAGAEIHFGFIDVPQLALQAGVGLSFSYDQTKAKQETVPSIKRDVTTYEFASSVQGNPWNIFTANVAALYYF